MDTELVMASLKGEGFGTVYLWRDAPDADYGEHAHRSLSAHVVIDGEITVTTSTGTHTYRAGDRFDLAAEEVHSALVGSRGCTYVVGEDSGPP